MKQRINIHPGSYILLPAGIWLSIFLILPLSILLVFSLGFRDELGRVHLGLNVANYWNFFTGPYLATL